MIPAVEPIKVDLPQARLAGVILRQLGTLSAQIGILDEATFEEVRLTA
jgi:hypothetical protein